MYKMCVYIWDLLGSSLSPVSVSRLHGWQCKLLGLFASSVAMWYSKQWEDEAMCVVSSCLIIVMAALSSLWWTMHAVIGLCIYVQEVLWCRVYCVLFDRYDDKKKKKPMNLPSLWITCKYVFNSISAMRKEASVVSLCKCYTVVFIIWKNPKT